MSSNYLFEQLSKINDKLDELSITLAENTVVLNDHKARSDRSEARLEALEDDYKKFRGFVSIGGWVLAIASTVITLVAKLYPLFIK